MTPYRLERSQWLPRTPEALFPFFADAHNLEKITPPWLNFEILTPPGFEISKGSRIDYRIRLYGLPVRWKTEITEWEPPRGFVDFQLQGPYRLWRHRHTFTAENGGTRCDDVVEFYPKGGALTYHLFVRREVEKIFDYRAEVLQRHFAE